MSEETAQPSESTATTEVTTEEATTVNAEGEAQSVTSYLDGKYNSVSDLESGYKELQSSYSKKLGAFTGSPDEYNFNEGIEVSDAVSAYAKENQFSNDALNGLAEVYQADMQSNRDAHVAEQKELLGKDGDQRIQNVVDWGRANLGEDALDTLHNMVTTAAGVEVFEKIAKMNSGTAPAQVATPKTTVDRDTLKQMQFATDEYGNRKMSDPAYKAKVDELYKQLG